MTKSQQDFREKILNAAQDIFSKFGFKKTTMDDIAMALHKTKGALYYYYKSKDEIFIAVAEKEIKFILDEIKKAIAQEDTPQKKMYAYCMMRIEVSNRLSKISNVFKNGFIEHHELVEKIKTKYFDAEHKIICSILKYGVDLGIFSIKDLDSTSENITTMLKGLEHSYAADGDMTKIENNIDNLMDILFYGVMKR